MKVHAYISFEGRCEEALNFYQQALGAEIVFLTRMSDAPAGSFPVPPEAANLIMHARIKIGDTIVMASDGMGQQAPSFKGITMSINAANADDAKRYFDALADGGTVTMPLQATFWSPAFGMLADRFGVPWMVNVDQ